MPVEIAAEQKYVSFLSNNLLGGSSRKNVREMSAWYYVYEDY